MQTETLCVCLIITYKVKVDFYLNSVLSYLSILHKSNALSLSYSVPCYKAHI